MSIAPSESADRLEKARSRLKAEREEDVKQGLKDGREAGREAALDWLGERDVRALRRAWDARECSGMAVAEAVPNVFADAVGGSLVDAYCAHRGIEARDLAKHQEPSEVYLAQWGVGFCEGALEVYAEIGSDV